MQGALPTTIRVLHGNKHKEKQWSTSVECIDLYLKCIQLQEALQHCLRALPHVEVAEPIPACSDDWHDQTTLSPSSFISH